MIAATAPIASPALAPAPRPSPPKFCAVCCPCPASADPEVPAADCELDVELMLAGPGVVPGDIVPALMASEVSEVVYRGGVAVGSVAEDVVVAMDMLVAVVVVTTAAQAPDTTDAATPTSLGLHAVARHPIATAPIVDECEGSH